MVRDQNRLNIINIIMLVCVLTLVLNLGYFFPASYALYHRQDQKLELMVGGDIGYNDVTVWVPQGTSNHKLTISVASHASRTNVGPQGPPPSPVFARWGPCQVNGNTVSGQGQPLQLGGWYFQENWPNGDPKGKSTIEAFLPIGKTTISCGASWIEGHPNSAIDGQLEMNIDVQVDNVPPTITTPDDITATSYANAHGTLVDYKANATDNTCNPYAPSQCGVQVTCNPSSGSFFKVGINTVTCSAKDKFNNSAEKKFLINVKEYGGLSGQEANSQNTGENAATSGSSQNSQNCGKIGIRDISASGFERDPADYHPPSSAIDGDSSTWWSNQGNSRLKIDLGKSNLICGVELQWNKGDIRKYNFEIMASEDGNEFKKVFEGTNKGGGSAVETFKFDEISGRYLNLDVTSNDKKGWVSIKEINALGHPTG
jgi:F5/8 type C domain/HYR domain